VKGINQLDTKILAFKVRRLFANFWCRSFGGSGVRRGYADWFGGLEDLRLRP
jgi:hypothetical protein